MPEFFPVVSLCHEYHTMRSMMDTDTGSHVPRSQTRQEGGHLRKQEILVSVQYGRPHLKE